ncbi:asparagine synthase (glutamine-hydrolyzing) [Nitrospira sp. Nam80]
MARTLAHRGPDGEGVWIGNSVVLGNRRLAVLDLSSRGGQPMVSQDGRYAITYNGEVYNYLELKAELGMAFETCTDTEVVLEAFARWGMDSVRRLNGMFAFAIWDRAANELYLIRDRFGVKPLYYAMVRGALHFASEVKALAAAGVPIEPEPDTWSTYLRYGVYDHGSNSFFKGIRKLPPGHCLVWRDGSHSIHGWYDLAARVQAWGPDLRSDDSVCEEYHELLKDAIRIRFRSDVPVGVCLSGGLDSSALIGLLGEVFGREQPIQSYHFACGDPLYDETPWVSRLLQGTEYPLHIARISVDEVRTLAEQAILYQEEPFGGLPTLAMTELFKLARKSGTVVLLDGQGLDEQWAGYSYYADSSASILAESLPLQGCRNGVTNGGVCLSEDFNSSHGKPDYPAPFHDRLSNLRYRDLRYTKLPRALRFNDRASSQVSCELREPFLDYRLVELAFRQPAHRLIRHNQHKYLLRRMVASLVPKEFQEAPKRPVQTPQREWLRGPLREWVEACLDHPAITHSGWFDAERLWQQWDGYLAGKSDNSFYVWQWISVALNQQFMDTLRASHSFTRSCNHDYTRSL